VRNLPMVAGCSPGHQQHLWRHRARPHRTGPAGGAM